MVDQLRRSAHVREMAHPLPAWVRASILAEANRLAGEDNHGHLFVQRRAHRHGAMKRTNGRMDYNRRELSTGLRIAARHAQRDLLVSGAHIERHSFHSRFGESLPQRRPLRSRRGKNSFHAHLAQHAKHRLRACQSFGLNHDDSLKFEFRIFRFLSSVLGTKLMRGGSLKFTRYSLSGLPTLFSPPRWGRVRVGVTRASASSVQVVKPLRVVFQDIFFCLHGEVLSAPDDHRRFRPAHIPVRIIGSVHESL